MANHRAIKDSLADWMGQRNLDKAEKKKRKLEKELEAQAEERERQADITCALTDVRVTLNMLNSKFEEIFEKELMTARRNAAKNIEDARNYAKIGIAYSSKQVVNAAKKRLEELNSTFEINTAMGELTSTLQMLNELPKMIGRVDSKDLNKAAMRMDKGSGSSGGDLVNAWSKLSGMELKGEIPLSTESLVSKDEIKRWIQDRDYAEECLEYGLNSEVNGDELLDAGARIFQSEDRKTSGNLNAMLEELRKGNANL